LLLNLQIILASGGFDHGTITGKNKLQIDLTLNPFNMIKYGQTYVVLSYGISEKLDVHGYFSHEPTDINQFYYGLMKQFKQTTLLDLSTAIGLRHRLKQKDFFFPQLLYTIKLNNFNIGGSIVAVSDLINKQFYGSTYDIAFFFPLKKLTKYIPLSEKIELGIGAFRNLNGELYPTYSFDMKFNLNYIKQNNNKENNIFKRL
jgi:hypothetical protein